METRGTQPPIPLNWRSYLTKEQHHSYNHIAKTGWTLYFIRRPVDKEPVIVVNNSSNNMAVIEKDGTINTNYAIKIR